jgi:hypothetical protein
MRFTAWLSVVRDRAKLVLNSDDFQIVEKGISSKADAKIATHAGDADAHGEPTVTTDSGTATADDLAFGVKGGEGIDTSGSGTDVTVAGENASTTNKGIASFNTNDFSVTSGAVSLKSIGARVYNSSNISIPDNTSVNLTFDSERYDTDDIHSTATDTERLTCKTAGIYIIIGNCRFATNATGRRFFSFRLNGGTYIAVEEWDTNQNFVTRPTICTIYQLDVDDYVVFSVLQTSGGALNIEAVGNYSPEFMMQKIG